MNDNSLQFTQLQVERMPGFQSGFTLTGLQPGINIIYGPNAAGKTTSATALNALLWPKHVHRQAEVVGHFVLDGSAWTIAIFGESRQCQKDGQSYDPPLLPPVEARDRYNLSLHTLLNADNKSFASAIVRETAGGYDIGEAAHAVGVKATLPIRITKESKAFLDALRSLREAKSKQESLRAEEASLASKRESRDRAREASSRAERLVRAIQHAEAQETFKKAEEFLNTFATGMDRLAEQDAQRLDELESNLASEREKLQSYEHDNDRARAETVACALPDEGVAAGLLPTLRQKGRKLGQLDEEIKTLQRELEGAKSRVLEAQQRIGNAVDDKRLQQLDVPSFSVLAEFARRAEIMRAKQHAITQTMRWLEPSGDAHDAATLRRGRLLLSNWLRTSEKRQNGPVWLPWLLLAVAMVILVESVMLVVQGAWPFLLGAFFGAALAVAGIILLILSLRRDKSPRHYMREEFERLDLDQPAEWNDESIQRSLDQLEQRIAHADMESERAMRRKDLAGERESLAEVQQQGGVQRVELLQRFGVSPAMAQGVDEAGLFLLAENVSRWQAAVQEGNGVNGQLNAARRQYQQILNELNQQLAAYNYQPAADVDEVAGYIEDLDERSQRFSKAQSNLENARKNAQDSRQRAQKLEAEIRAFFVDRDIEPGDQVTLQHRLGRLQEYMDAKDAVGRATYQLEQTRSAVEDYPELNEMSLESLERESLKAKETAAQQEIIADEIARIEERVRLAKEGSELGDALARRDETAEALRESRDKEYQAAVCFALAEYLKRETSEQTRPAVFRRARELFARITNGKYELLLDEEGPAFRAKDSITNMGQSLDELSSATRIQLLMAVRLAFIEEQEQGCKLPVFFDETLGNSDEERARAIILSTAELARQGRQIFYFTAQLDEVNKWRGLVADGDGIGLNIVNLAEVRRLSELDQLPLPDEPFQLEEVPVPDVMSYMEYGNALKVANIDLTRADADGVHLWHLMEDSQLLYQILSQGVSTFGQLRTLAELSDVSTVGIAQSEYDRIIAAVRAIEEAIKCWQIGRGKPVDRQALLDSGHVSDIYMETLSDLARELSGDGQALIDAIGAKQVRGFRTKNRDGLREFFEENGYIDGRERLDRERILLGVKAALASEMQQGYITGLRADELVDRVLGFGAAET